MGIFAETEQRARVVCSGSECGVGGKYKEKVSGAALRWSRVHLALNLCVLALIAQDRETFGFLAKEMFETLSRCFFKKGLNLSMCLITLIKMSLCHSTFTQEN